MESIHRDLLDRIESYNLGGEGSPKTFANKLARQNRWSASFTERVIQEYKRFAFLSVAAGHPVAPSDIVDQPWHLHLMFTQDYWGRFCPEVLGKHLHHQPSTGASGDQAKFEDWYRRTLESYERILGEKPPKDIWPHPDKTQVHQPDHVRVDRATYWIVPRPRLRFSWMAAGAALALLSLGCADAAVSANPLDWAGQEFLTFYIALYAVAFAAAWTVLWALRAPSSGESGLDLVLDPYSVGYLSGGPVAAANVAIAGLVRDGSLFFDSDTQALAPSGHPVPTSKMRPIDMRVHKAVASIPGGSAQLVRDAVAGSIEPIARELRSKGLLMSPAKIRAAVIVPNLIAALPVVFGIAKVVLGIERERPVEILLALLLASITFNCLSFVKKPSLTRYGESVLASMRLKNAGLRTPGAAPLSHAPRSVMLGVALFGPRTLAGTGLDIALTPPRTLKTEADRVFGGNDQCAGSFGSQGGGVNFTGAVSSWEGGGGGGCGGCSSS